jgi:hypothetical protein
MDHILLHDSTCFVFHVGDHLLIKEALTGADLTIPYLVPTWPFHYPHGHIRYAIPDRGRYW